MIITKEEIIKEIIEKTGLTDIANATITARLFKDWDMFYGENFYRIETKFFIDGKIIYTALIDFNLGLKKQAENLVKELIRK